MNLIDLHCDTALKLLDSKKGDTLKENDFCIRLDKLKKAGSLAQFFACFVYMEQFQGEDRYARGYQNARDLIMKMRQEVGKYPDEIAFAGGYEEIMSNREAGKISAVLTVEEGGIVDNDLAKVEELYVQGVRLITLLWNYENGIGYPNSRDVSVMQKGLKPFGFEMVEKMNEQRMIVDVSHLSDGGFRDVIRHSKAPVVASHSNARALCNHPRNLTDEMLKALAEKGGVTGINFYPAFVREDQIATAEDLVRHIRHIVQVAGSDVVAIGTDFDGFDGGELEIPSIGEIELLYDTLHRNGFSDSQIEKFRSGNALRVIKEVL